MGKRFTASCADEENLVSANEYTGSSGGKPVTDEEVKRLRKQYGARKIFRAAALYINVSVCTAVCAF